MACHGPNCDGSFWPPASPANARNALLACDLKMKMRMMLPPLGLKSRRLWIGGGPIQNRRVQTSSIVPTAVLPLRGSAWVSNFTFWPSRRPWMPARSSAVAWTNDVLLAVVRLDEAEAFLVVVELDGAVSHRGSLSFAYARGMWRTDIVAIVPFRRFW